MDPQASETINRSRSAPERDSHGQGPTLIDTVRVVLHHRRLVFGTPAGLALLVVIVSLLWWRTYSVSASFVPQSTPSALAGLAGVASQFGFALPGADQSESPDFYAALITSPQVLRAVVESDYVLLADGEATRGNLVTHYKIRSGTPEEGREKAVNRSKEQHFGVGWPQNRGCHLCCERPLRPDSTCHRRASACVGQRLQPHLSPDASCSSALVYRGPIP